MKFFNQLFVFTLCPSILLVSCAKNPPKPQQPDYFSQEYNSIYSRKIASEISNSLHGLNEVEISSLDQWTNGFIVGEKTRNTNFNAQKISESIIKIAKSSNNNIVDFLNQVLGLNLHKPYDEFPAYKAIIEGFFSAKHQLRKYQFQNDETLEYKRKVFMLINILAEEVLYASFKMYPAYRKIKFHYANIHSTLCPRGQTSSHLNDIHLCTGDVVVSKGGSPSSSFIAKIPDLPGNYSHGVIAYINPKLNNYDDKKLSFIEADIEDGVKLRTPKKEYIQSQKSKLIVYRSIDAQTVRKVGQHTQNFVDAMIKSVGSFENAFSIPSFPYDFSMRAEIFNLKPSTHQSISPIPELFCSEIPYVIYGQDATLKNPYAQMYWSSLARGPRQKFLKDFLQSKDVFPAPSDVELNPDFDILAMHFDSSKIPLDRIYSALTDLLNIYMIEHGEKFIQLTNSIFGDPKHPLDKEFILQNLQRFQALFPGYQSQDILGTLEKVPEGITLRQLFFFSILNEYLGKKIQEHFSTLEVAGKHLTMSELRLETNRVLVELMGDLLKISLK